MTVAFWFPNVVEYRLVIFHAAGSFTRIEGQFVRVAGFRCGYSRSPENPFRAEVDLRVLANPESVAMAEQDAADLFRGACSPWPLGRVADISSQ